MAGTVERLPGIEAEPDVRGGEGGEDHPMRIVTREALTGPAGWSDDRRSEVNDLFDALAGEWHTRGGPGRVLPVLDALDRSGVSGGRALELGSGTGLVSGRLADRFDRLVAVDLSVEMLRRAPTVAPRLRADAACLPLPDGAVDVLLLLNMLLFPEEADRVLAPGGALVWVNSRGPVTPIHLPAEDVVAALPGRWTAVASSHGRASWCVAGRVSSG